MKIIRCTWLAAVKVLSGLFWAVLLALLGVCRRPLPIPGRVDLTSPPDGATLREAQVTLLWTDAESSASYVIEVSQNERFTSLVCTDTLAESRSVLQLQCDGVYYWRVRPVSADGVAGFWSSIRQFRLERFGITAELALSGYPHRIAIVGNTACIACGQAGLVLVDISDPLIPKIQANLMDSLNEAWGVTANESLAFVAYGNKELMIVDIRRPDSLLVLGVLEYPQPAYGYSVALIDTFACIAADAQFILTDISDPRYPALVFQYYYPRSCRDVSIADRRGYVAIEQLGIAVWRLDTFPPRQISSLDTPGNARGIAVAGNYAFVADGRAGLLVSDVSNPAQPVQVARLALTGYANALTLKDSFAFIGCGSGGIVVVNVARPSSPFLVAQIPTSYAMGLVSSGGRVYVCDRDRGLLVLEQFE